MLPLGDWSSLLTGDNVNKIIFLNKNQGLINFKLPVVLYLFASFYFTIKFKFNLLGKNVYLTIKPEGDEKVPSSHSSHN